MASYFDEHDCLPLGDNERPNELLMLARLLVDSGISDGFNMNSEKLPPPVSKSWLKEEFPKYCFNEANKPEHQCPICLKKFSSQSESAQNAIELPICKHSFHSDCLMKWLEKSSNCPLCRYDLPTDDADYERYKKQKKREKVREQELEDLHSSMYS